MKSFLPYSIALSLISLNIFADMQQSTACVILDEKNISDIQMHYYHDDTTQQLRKLPLAAHACHRLFKVIDKQDTQYLFVYSTSYYDSADQIAVDYHHHKLDSKYDCAVPLADFFVHDDSVVVQQRVTRSPSGTFNLSELTPGLPLVLDGDLNVISQLINIVEQSSGVLTIAQGGTNSSTALSSNRLMQSQAGKIVEASALQNGQLLIGSTNNVPIAGAISGTASQINVTNGPGSITLSTPQNIDLTSTPTFAALNLQSAGTNKTVTVQATPSLTSNYTVLLPLNGPQALTVYVAINGNDTTGDGTFANPFASLKRALVTANYIAGQGSPTSPLPVSIQIGAGTFVEDLSQGPLAVTASPITISGVSNISTILTSLTTTQTMLYLPITTNVQNIGIFEGPNGPLLCGVQTDDSYTSMGAANNSGLFNIGVVGCQIAFNLTGGPGTNYFLNGCETESCGVGVIINNARCAFYNTILFGAQTASGLPTPANLGLLVTGPYATLISESTSFLYCQTGAQLSNYANVQIIGGSFSGNLVGLVCDSQSNSEINGTTFILNENINIFATDPSTMLQTTACNINGTSAMGNKQGTGLLARDGAIVNFSSSSLNNLTDGIITGSPNEFTGAQLLATGVTIENCTDKQIIQNDASTIAFIGGSFDRGQVTINTPGNVSFNSSDSSSNQATVIGQHTNATQDIILIDTGEQTIPAITYQNDYLNAQGLIYSNPNNQATVSGLQAASSDAYLSVVTNQNTQATSVKLYSGNGTASTNLRGWDLIKTATNANLAFNFLNNDTVSTQTISSYCPVYIDGFNNVLNFPLVSTAYMPTNQTTLLNWAGDANLYRSAAGVLKTDNNFALGGLGTIASAGQALSINSSNVIQASATTATELGYVHNVTGPIQEQLNLLFPSAGGTLSGALTLPQGSSSASSLNFNSYPTTGLSAASGVLSLNVTGNSALSINPNGNVIIAQASSGTTLTVTGGGASISGNLTIPSGSGRVITDAVTLNNNPVAPSDATNKAYVDSVAQGISVKSPCDVVNAVNNTALTGFPVIDGMATTTGNRVLLTMETNGTQNGIWQINSGGTWVRPTDFYTGESAVSAYTFITSGNTFANSSFICTNTIGNATIDVNALNFVEFSNVQTAVGQNIGIGTSPVGVYAQKIGNTLQFKSLDAGSNISLSSNSTDITVGLISNPSVSSLNVTGQITAGTLSDGVGVTISNGTINAANLITTTTIRAADGATANPSISFANYPTTGFSVPSANTLALSTAGVNQLQINAAGTITIPAFNAAGVVHNDGSGNLSTSQIVNADVSSSAAIVDSKLATISSTGKVANTATSGNSASVANTLVMRDGSANFAANQITAASSFLAANGTDATPAISFTNSSGAGLSSPVVGQLDICSGSAGSGVAQIILNNSGTQVQLPLLTASAPLQLDSNKNIMSGSINLASQVSGILPNSATTATSSSNPSTIVSRDSSGNFSAGTITANLAGNATSAGTSINTATAVYFTGPLAGDVTGTEFATTVAQVGGISAATIASGVNAANNATYSNSPSSIIARDGSGNFNASTITANLTGSATYATNAGTSINTATAVYFTGPLVGDVTGTEFATSVAQVGGVSAANVALGSNTANAATSSNNANTIVKRDASGNFIASTITANLTGSATYATNSGTSINTTTAVYFTGPLVGDVTGTEFATSVAQVGGVSAVNIASGANAANAATNSNSANTLVKRDALGNFNAGTISAQNLVAINPTNQLVLGSGNNVTLSAQSLLSSHTYYLADVTATSTFVMVDGAQIINGLKSFNNSLTMLGQNAVKFYDATNANFVGIQAPTAVTAPGYTFALPAVTPGAQKILMSSGTAPYTVTSWSDVGDPLTLYVSMEGSDTVGNGSFNAPFRTLKQALAIANAQATEYTPMRIDIGTGIFVEDTSTGPLQINNPYFHIVGVSSGTTLLTSAITTQTFLQVTASTGIERLGIFGISGAPAIAASGFANNSTFEQMEIVECLQGFVFTGGIYTEYYINGSACIGCGIGVEFNNCHGVLYNHVTIGPDPVHYPEPLNTGLLVTGPETLMVADSNSFLFCDLGAQVTDQANVSFIGGSFLGTNTAVMITSGSNVTTNGTTYIQNNNANIAAQDSNTLLQVTACNINGMNANGTTPQGTGVLVTAGAQANVASSSLANLVNGLIVGVSSDTNATSLLANNITIQNCTTAHLVQNGMAGLSFVGGSFNRGLVQINNPGSVVFNASDVSSNQAQVIGQHANITQDLILIDNGSQSLPAITYQSDYLSGEGLVYSNPNNQATMCGVQAALTDVFTTVVTNQNTQSSGLKLYSGNGTSSTNLRGWDLIKTATLAHLAINFLNNDTISTQTISSYCPAYIDGFNNVLNFPLVSTTYMPTNQTAQLNWAGDTNLYRSATGILKTDNNFAIGTLGASVSGYALAAASGSNIIQASNTTATELGYVHNVTGPIQAQLNALFPSTGGTLSGALTLPQGSSSAPSLNFSGFSTTGLSAASGGLALNTAGKSAITITQNGNVTIAQAASGTTFTVTGGGASISGNLTIPSGTGRVITDAVTLNNSPVASTDATSKAYVDSVAQGISVKSPCTVVNTINNTALTGFPVIDGIVTTTGNRVLLTMETNGTQNGIWQINSGGTWARPTDFYTGGSAVSAYTFITSGNAFANSSFICTNTIGNATIGTSSLNFVEFSQSQNITAANVGVGASPVGVFAQQTGNVLQFKSLDAGSNISLSPNSTDITVGLISNPSVSSLNVSGQITAGTFSDGVGVTISNGTINAANLITTTTIRAADGSTVNPSISFANYPTTGFSVPSANTLAFSTAGVNQLQINSAGTITIPAFTAAGVVHNDSSGNISTSQIVNADISSSAAITDSKLATISSTGKVANSATSGSSGNTANALVLRDSSGNFISNQITAASSFLAPNGSTTVPSISFTNSLGAGLASPVAGQLNIISGTAGAGAAQIVLNNAGNTIQFPLFGAGIVRSNATGILGYGSVGLATSDVSGVLPIANGGTGSNNSLSNAVLLSNANGLQLTNGQIIIGSTGTTPVAATILSTANQTTITNGAGSITVGTVQNIGQTSTPTFASETLSSVSNQLTLGTTNQTIINAAAPAATRTYTIPDTGANSQFVMTDGNQAINGTKTFSGATNLSGLTASLPLQLDANKNIIAAQLNVNTVLTGTLPVTLGGTGSNYLGTNAVLASNSTGTAIIPVTLGAGQILIGTSGAPSANTLAGTTNQISVVSSSGSIVISTPQNIATSSSPTFASETLNSAKNQLTLGSGNNVTLSAQSLLLSHTYYFPDLTATSTFVMVDGAQTIGGAKTFNAVTTFNNTLNLANLTASLPLQLNSSKNVVSQAINLASSQVSGTLPIVNGGTNSSTALANNLVMVSSGGQIVESPVTTTQLNLLPNATSSATNNTLVLRDSTGSLSATNVSIAGNMLLPNAADGVLACVSNTVNTSVGSSGYRLASFANQTPTVGWYRPLMGPLESFVFDDFNSNFPYNATFFDTEWYTGGTTTNGNFNAVTATSAANGVGLVSMNTTAGSSDYTVMNKQLGGTWLGLGTCFVEWRVAVPTLSTGSTTGQFTFRCGLGDSTAGQGTAPKVATPPTNGIFFEHNSTSGNWLVKTVVAGTVSTTTTSQVISTNTYYRLGFLVNADGNSVIFYINDVPVGTITNTPNVALGLFAHIVNGTNTGSNSHSTYLDYATYHYVFTNAR